MTRHSAETVRMVLPQGHMLQKKEPYAGYHGLMKEGESSHSGSTLVACFRGGPRHIGGQQATALRLFLMQRKAQRRGHSSEV